MKKIGFLSFGHWTASPHSQVRTGADALTQSIELAVAAEELGADGAYFRVHHFARQLGSPFPLLAAVGARTKTIEIGTAVIDMRYENPLYMAEDAGAKTARPTPTWRAVMRKYSSKCSKAKGSRSRIRGRCFRIHPASYAWSRTRRGCANGSGGGRARTLRPSGPPAWA